MKVERWVVVSGKPELVTLKDGRVVSLPKGSDPVELQRDSKFKRLVAARKLQSVMVDVPEPEEAEETEPEEEEPEEPDEETDPEPEEPDEEADPEPEEPGEEAEAEGVPLGDTGLRSSLVAALVDAGFGTLDRLSEKVQSDGLSSLLEVHGVGEGSLDDIETLLDNESN